MRATSFWSAGMPATALRVLSTGILLAVSCCALADDTSLRVRISWGGGSERLWQGSVTLYQGSITAFTPLGIEADEPGSMWLDQGKLAVRQRSPRGYDGVELSLTGPTAATLAVSLSAAGQPPMAKPIEVPLDGQLRAPFDAPLDDSGNRLLVARAPGDELRVSCEGDSLVLAPGEKLRLTLEPSLGQVPDGTTIKIQLSLCAARSAHATYSADYELTLGESPPLAIEIPAPAAEGAYDAVFTAAQPSSFSLSAVGRSPLGFGEPLAVRKVQFLVLSPQRPPAATSAAHLALVDEIDPANPRWWERLPRVQQLANLKRLWRGPLGNGFTHTCRHALGDAVQLAPTQRPADPAWEAYPLAVRRPGMPHVVEVEYPSDLPQTLGISIVEPNVSGGLFPLALDSGVDVAHELAAAAGPPRWLKHRIVFWPRTKTPLVLLTNRRDRTAAVFGKIRLYDGWERLPAAFNASTPPKRLLAAYFDRPLFLENFSAPEAPGLLNDLGVDDWLTFYQGGTRLVEYLHYAGYGGVMVSVLAQGSTIYPSRLVEPTPRYDTGLFLEAGQDPVRKDALEMLLRLCDRERLQFFPAIDFAAPLPELERLKRLGGADANGLTWIGAKGQDLQQLRGVERHQSPYYNVLDPRVQQAMLAVVREVVVRCGRHSSFAGVGLQLSAYGYAQLPGMDWGVDDATVARFEQATALKLGFTGPERFDQRIAALTGAHARQWQQWRADELSRFYRLMEAEIAAARPGAKLYLAGGQLLSGGEAEAALKPELPRGITLSDTLLATGIDVRGYGQLSAPLLLRPERVSPRWSLPRQAVDLQIERLADADGIFQSHATPACLFYHRPQELRLASFDSRSPYQPCYMWLATQAVPSAAQNRRRLVHALATIDPQIVFEGSWMLPMGQEEAVRPLWALYRSLPAVKFERVAEPPGGPAAQPLAFRFCSQGEATYLYIVNDAPFATTAGIKTSASPNCLIEEVSGLRKLPPLESDGDGSKWTVALEPYDAVGVRFAAKDVRFSQPSADFSPRIRETLDARIAELGQRMASLRSPPPLEALENPGFERPQTASQLSEGWTVTTGPGSSATLDNQAHGGRQAVRLQSEGATASLVSAPFNAPNTGRLTMSVWLKIADSQRQPVLQLGLQGMLDGRPFHRVAYVGRSSDAATPVRPLDAAWAPLVVRVDDLPLEGLSQLQIRFDLAGPGEVWIDDVQLCALDFSEEYVELLKLLWPAEGYLQNGRVGDCINLLEGYWPRFLTTYVPVAPAALAAAPATPSPRRTPSPPTEETAGFLSRVRRLLPERLRF